MSSLTRDPHLADGEARLIERIAGGDHAEFEKLMRRYNQRLYRIARATLGDPGEAQDAMQEAYLAAYRALGQFRGDAAIGTWLSRLVLNECLGRLRRSQRRQNVIPIVSLNVDINKVASSDAELPDRLLGRAEIQALLERKLDAIPQSFRVVFVLRSVEELSVEETARCLGIPEATVRSRHFRAKSLLRESLAQDIDLAERDVFEFGGTNCAGVVAKVMARLNS